MKHLDLESLKLKKTPLNIMKDSSGNTIYIKEESKNPSGSIKDRVFLYVLNKLTREGLYKKGDTLVIASSGNAAISLATFAPYFFLNTKVFMPSSTSSERRTIMNVMGIESYYIEGGMQNTITAAKKEALKDHHHYIDQFFDPTFLEAHEDTAAEIFSEISDLDYFVTGVGTGVTFNALGRRLKEHYPDLKIITYEPDESPSLSEGVFKPHSLEGVGPNFYPTNFIKERAEKIIRIDKTEAYDLAIKLIRLGYNYGITTAASLASILKSDLSNKKILIVNYDSSAKYLEVLNHYVQEKG